ncbi:MAG: putative transposase [Paracoccaceae bacterium]|jgi:putative transposase
MRRNQVWCSDITYIPVRNGFLYLVAIMDRATRKVLTRRLSKTLDASFCVEALAEAIARYGKPEWTCRGLVPVTLEQCLL